MVMLVVIMKREIWRMFLVLNNSDGLVGYVFFLMKGLVHRTGFFKKQFHVFPQLKQHYNKHTHLVAEVTVVFVSMVKLLPKVHNNPGVWRVLLVLFQFLLGFLFI